jgi:hypothetical protein
MKKLRVLAEARREFADAHHVSYQDGKLQCLHIHEAAVVAWLRPARR